MKEIISKYGDQIMVYARQYASSGVDPEDIVQEAFIRLWRSKKHTHERKLVYLYMYARQAAIDLFRSQKRRKKREDKFSQTFYETQPEFVCDLEKDEFRQSIEKCMRKLPIEQKEVLTMKLWGDLTLSEISQALDISPNTAASRYRYALVALKGIIEDKECA